MCTIFITRCLVWIEIHPGSPVPPIKFPLIYIGIYLAIITPVIPHTEEAKRAAYTELE